MTGSRRAFIGWSLGWIATLRAGPARAGSYLDRAALLVAQAVDADRFVEKRLRDAELCRLAAELAEARLRAAKATVVPKEVALAHPHLLLMLEQYERAASAAAQREIPRYYARRRKALDEEQLFRNVLEQLGWPLPDGKGKR